MTAQSVSDGPYRCHCTVVDRASQLARTCARVQRAKPGRIGGSEPPRCPSLHEARDRPRAFGGRARRAHGREQREREREQRERERTRERERERESARANEKERETEREKKREE